MNMTQISLYEAANQVAHLLDQVDEDGCYPDEALDALAAFDSKGIATTAYILNLRAEAAMIRDAASRMGMRADPLEKREKRLVEYLQANMKRTGITEIKSPEFNVKLELERDASVDVFDEKQLPDAYIVTKTTVSKSPDKKAISAAIKAGKEVAGARIVKNDRLTIK